MSLFYPELSKRALFHCVKAKVIQMPHQVVCDLSSPNTPALALGSICMLPASRVLSELPYLKCQLLSLTTYSSPCVLVLCKLVTNLRICVYVSRQCSSVQISLFLWGSLPWLPSVISPSMTVYPPITLFYFSCSTFTIKLSCFLICVLP